MAVSGVRRYAKYAVLLAEILFRSHVEIDGRRFDDRAHPPAAAGELRVRIFDAEKRVAPGAWLLQTADEPDEGRFARAVAPDKAVDRALGDVHGAAVQCGERPVALLQSGGLQYIFHKTGPSFA